MNMNKLGNSFMLLVLLLFCVSCAAAPQPQVITKTVFQDVYIPVACEEELPPRPQASANIELMVINVLEYAQVLEVKLMICTGKIHPNGDLP